MMKKIISKKDMKRKINILFPMISRKPSGGFKVIYEYCNYFANDDFDVEIYYLPDLIFSSYHLPEAIRKMLAKLYGDIIGPRKWFALDKRIKNKVIDNADEMREADYVVATSIETAKPVFDLPGKYGQKIYFIQDYENWKYSDSYVRSTYALGMNNIVISKWLKQIVDKYSEKPSVLISDGIDSNIFYPIASKRRSHSIVFQYREAPQKGCKYAFDAIEILQSQYSDLIVNIITMEPNKPNAPSCCRYFKNLTPQQVAEINNRSEVFICSTIDEGFGLPGLEAMACGCAVASTDYTGIHEYAIDGVNALLSPVKDAKALADNVVKLFENDVLREKIVRAGIETGKSITVENSYKKFRKVLDDMILEK